MASDGERGDRADHDRHGDADEGGGAGELGRDRRGRRLQRIGGVAHDADDRPAGAGHGHRQGEGERGDGGRRFGHGDRRRAEHGEGGERDDRRGQVAEEHPPPWSWHPVGDVRVVDLLRQRLDGVEAEKVEGDAGRQHRRRGAAEHGDDGEGGEDGQGGHPRQP